MSLQLAAQHLASHGRGDDKVLVHMTPGEVKSLNDLAMAHGGQLTINPHTGLPEAGFLSSLLPMVAGLALNAAVPGLGAAMGGFAIPAIVGGGSYLMNPKGGIMGGLMAGLGAYGGMGLGSGLENIATSEAGATAQNAATDASAKAEADAISARNLETANQQVSQKAAENSLVGRTDLTRAQMENSLMPQNQLQPLTEAQLQPIRDNALLESITNAPKAPTGFDAMYKGAESLASNPTADKFKTLGGGSYMGLAKTGLAAAAPVAAEGLNQNGITVPTTQQKAQVVPHYRFNPGMVSPTPAAGTTGVENTYFNPSYTALSNEEAGKLYPGYPAAMAANGGLMAFGAGGETEDPYRTTPDDTLETAYAKAQEKNDISTMRAIEREKEIRDTNKAGMTKGLSGMKGLATGGLSDARYNLGGYSDGGRLLRGPGDGVSDSIPAVIGRKQPARLADGEFVVPARIVSEIGNGSTEAGARKLYAMMDRIQAARGKTVGKGKIAKNTRADKYLPA